SATGTLIAQLLVPGICRVAFSPDGRWLMTSSGGCRLWRVGRWTESRDLRGAHGCFSPDGTLVAVDDTPSAIRLIRTYTGVELARLEAPEQSTLTPSALSPDGSQLIAFGGDTHALHVWNLAAVRRGLGKLGLDWSEPENRSMPPTSDEARQDLRSNQL